MNQLYFYPAIFKKEKGAESILVIFPDFQHCFTSAVGMEQAMILAKDLLAATICELEERKEIIPKRSDLSDLTETLEEDEVLSYVDCDTGRYRRKHRNACVKKTLTIPSWLNFMAEECNTNFSAVLQKALKQELGLDESS